MYYFRYADDFILGAEASKNDCIELINKMNHFLQMELNMVLNQDKTEVTNAQKEITKFLGYYIHKPATSKVPFRRNKFGRLCQIISRPVLSAPIEDIMKGFIEREYVTKAGKPTRNPRLVNHKLSDIISHYRAVESDIMNYYLLVDNYVKLAAKVHFILKYSCVLTIASKMKLKTTKKVFKKYGKNLKILNHKGKIISNYPTIRYQKLRKTLNFLK